MATAKRLETGSYLYRGYRIDKIDDHGYTMWNIFAPDGTCDESADTLSQAKDMVDRMLN